MSVPKIYLATVCIERNRWGSRVPSVPISEWLTRIIGDKFDGVELWENHYVAVDDAERARLRDGRSAVAIFNSYCPFTDDTADARHRAAEAVRELEAAGVKYNLGPDAARLEEYRRNLLAWSDVVPSGCRLLCECHPGTVLEKLEPTVEFFRDLDPVRFGVIAHMMDDAALLERSVVTLGARLQHLHLQLREPGHATPESRAKQADCVRVLKANQFRGSISVEFTRGISKDEQVSAIYANAIADATSFRDAWG